MEINIFWILVVVVFILLMRNTKNKILKKAVGSFLIIFGIFIFSPIPSVDDAVLLPLFASFTGNELTIEGIKQMLLPYTLFTAGIGLAIAYTGIYISGLKLKDLKNKIKRVFK